MDLYEYTAKNLDGNMKRAKIKASDEEHAYEQIRSMGFYVVKLHKVKQNHQNHMLKSHDLAKFCRQLSLMLNSNIPLAHALHVMKKREQRPILVSIYGELYEQLVVGTPFYEAMEAQDVFPNLLINSFLAGEVSGDLGTSAKKMATYYEKEERLKKKVISAMAYPCCLLLLVLVSMIGMFTFVLPKFFSLFESMESLPTSTKVLIYISKGMQENLPIFLFVLVGILAGILFLIQRPVIRKWMDHMLLYIPIFGRLKRIIIAARFARTLSSLYGCSLPLVQSVQIASTVIGNRFIEEQFQSVIEKICDGAALFAALSNVEGLDDELITGIYIGEEAGKLNLMLEHLADNYECEAEESTTRMTALIEPIMIIIMAILIGYIMLSVMLPIYQYYQTLA